MSLFYFDGLPAGEAIREYLLAVGTGNPYSFFKLWRQHKKVTSYKAVRKLFYVLRQLGLIEFAGFEPAATSTGFKKRMYRIVPGQENSKAWLHPQAELYPGTGLGSKGYKDLEERGLTPKGGRAKQYIK